MRTLFQQWLDRRGRPPGCLASGIHLSKIACLTPKNQEELPRDCLHMAWRLAAESASVLAAHDIVPLRLMWRFHDGEFHFVLRPDGAGLGVLAESRAGDTEELQQYFDEFLALG